MCIGGHRKATWRFDGLHQNDNLLENITNNNNKYNDMNKSEFEKADLREKHIQNFLKNSVYSLIITHTKL